MVSENPQLPQTNPYFPESLARLPVKNFRHILIYFNKINHSTALSARLPKISHDNLECKLAREISILKFHACVS